MPPSEFDGPVAQSPVDRFPGDRFMWSAEETPRSCRTTHRLTVWEAHLSVSKETWCGGLQDVYDQ